jgi:uncharacterized protein with ParB-like and HNH nuclease domain
MSTIEQGLELLTLKQVFDEGKRSFRIPAYQRGYSWEEDQRKDLLKDIEYGMSGDYSHYTGTLVAVKKSSIIQDNEHFETFEIVDGQQRLTTLIILLSCMAHAFKRVDTTAPEDLRRYFIEDGSEHGNTHRKFILSDEQDNLFWEKVDESDFDSSGKIKNKGDQNIVDAFDQFKKWLALKNETSLCEIYGYVTNELGFLMYAPDDTKEIGIMFEVINNRGKPLSELEKVKNYLMYYSEKNDIQDLKAVVKNKWPNILGHLNSCNHTSNDDENGFLRNCWIVFQDTNKSKSFYVYDNLKDQFPTTETSGGHLKDWKRLKRNRTWRYWCEVYARFFDLHEEKYANFALDRWRVDGITNPVQEVALNSLSDSNTIHMYNDGNYLTRPLLGRMLFRRCSSPRLYPCSGFLW